MESGGTSTDRLYIYAGETLVAIRTGTASGVTLAYAHTDHLGSTDVLTDASGTVVEAFSFAAFGSRRQADWSDPAGPLGSTLTPRGYTGHLQLDAVGLVHMGARVYDPQLGRFLSPDALVESLTDTQALNRYSYVRNNPLSRTDPTGNASLNAAGLPPSLSGQAAPGMSQWQWDGFAEGPASRWSTLFTFGADLDQPGFTGFPMLYNSGGQYGDASLPFDRNSARTMEAGASGLLANGWDDGAAVFDATLSQRFLQGSEPLPSLSVSNQQMYIPSDQESYSDSPYYHYYQLNNFICSTGQSGCSAGKVFEGLRRYPAPGHDPSKLIQDFYATEIKFLGISGGTVRHFVDDANLTVYNITEPGHIFESGYVQRSVISRDGPIYIQTTGEGANNSAFANWLNMQTYRPGFNELDSQIRSFVIDGN